MIRSLTELLKIPESVRVPYLGGKWYRFLNLIDNKTILKERIVSNPINQEQRNEKVTISLTSYPERISFVYLAIKSLMNQTYKPDEIILWLAEEQFVNRKIPVQLTELVHQGLQICWMHDIFGHKKYFYPIINQSENEVVITYDDDIIYSNKSIERLMKTHKKHPNCLVCERGQSYDATIPYNPGKWPTISDIGVEVSSYSINPSPGGGCLIPYRAFDSEVCNEEVIRKLAYKNDDLWYMFMCANNGTRIIKTRKFHRTFSTINGTQHEQMATNNITNNYNSYAMEKLISAYPKAWRRIVTNED